MKAGGWIILIMLCCSKALAYTGAEAQTNDTLCSQTSYYCIDPQGVPFATVGPITMWYNRVEQGCIPSPVSHVDGCVQVTQICNNLYPQRCKNDCLAGDSVSYVQERSCTGITPISPQTSVPNIVHDVYFQR